MKKILCTATAPGAFTEGNLYPVVSEDTWAYTLIDDKGQHHFVRKDMVFQKDHFKEA